MTRSELKTLFYFLLRQKSTNCSVTDTELNVLLNLGYQTLMREWLEGLTAKNFVKSPATTFVSRESATSITVASATNFSANTHICIRSASRYDTVFVTNIVGNILTLAEPGLIYTGFTTAAVITPMSFIIPNLRDVIGILWNEIEATGNVNTIQEMEHISDIEMYRLGTQPQSYGTPKYFSFYANLEVYVYPVPEKAGILLVKYLHRSASTLDGDDAVPEFLFEYHPGIVYHALASTLLREGNYQSYVVYATKFNEIITQIRSDYTIKYGSAQHLDFPRKGLV